MSEFHSCFVTISHQIHKSFIQTIGCANYNVIDSNQENLDYYQQSTINELHEISHFQSEAIICQLWCVRGRPFD